MLEATVFVLSVIALMISRSRRFLDLFRAFSEWDMFTAKKRRTGHDDGETGSGPTD